MIIKGFDSEVFDSQSVFRKVLCAMASPGKRMDIGMDMAPPGTLHPASGAILLTLLDFETPLWSDLENASPEIQWLKFHTGAPYTLSKRNSLFALQADYDRLDDPSLFNPGSVESPDMSTTLIVQTRGVDDTGRIRLTGPGLKQPAFLKLTGVTETFLKQRAALFLSYPRGVDMLFVCDRAFVAIPRTTRMEVL